MENHASRLMEQLEKEQRTAFLEHAGSVEEKVSPLKQAKYIDTCLKFGETQGISLTPALRKCGECCISNTILLTAQKLYAQSGTLAEFLGKLNEKHIGGGKLHLEADHRIIGVYEHCYCGTAQALPGMDPGYCECSAGWFQTLFSHVLGDSVRVTIRKTILSGAEECTFLIHVPTPLQK